MNKPPLYPANTWIYPMQFLFVICIISLLIMIALSQVQVPKMKAHLANLFFNVSVAKQEVTLFHALHGRWPDKDDLQAVFQADEIYDGIELDNGSFSLVYNNSGVAGVPGRYRLAFHRLEYRGAPPATVMWTCAPPAQAGNAKLHRADTSSNVTSNIAPEFLPSICR